LVSSLIAYLLSLKQREEKVMTIGNRKLFLVLSSASQE
jgi:hypothetical protein